jgi:hypothetical protein
MNKRKRKLVLSRETLRTLDNLRGLAGGVSITCGCGPLTISRCGGCTREGTYDTCVNTYEACSVDFCQTGGACTVTCESCASCDPICG